MKKITFLLLLSVLILSGCSKADGGKSLEGSAFQSDAYSAMFYTLLGYYYHVFEFETKSSGVAYWADKNGRQNGSDGNFTYTYEHPDLYITNKSGKEHYVFIDSRTFVMVSDSGEQLKTIKYYKR